MAHANHFSSDLLLHPAGVVDLQPCSSWHFSVKGWNVAAQNTESSVHGGIFCTDIREHYLPIYPFSLALSFS